MSTPAKVPIIRKSIAYALTFIQPSGTTLNLFAIAYLRSSCIKKIAGNIHLPTISASFPVNIYPQTAEDPGV
jgi:hypothetical protein